VLRFTLVRLSFVLAVSLGIVFFAFFGIEMASNSSSERPSYNPLPPAHQALTQTARYLSRLVQGDWGTMLVPRGRQTRSVTVGSVLGDAYPKSIILIVLALIIAGGVGIPIGVFAALNRYTPFSLGTMTWTLLGISLPSFSVAALLQLAEITWYRAFGFALLPSGGFGWDAHLVIPSLVLAARPLAYLARIAYLTFDEILDQDYMRTARAKGLLKGMILRAHAYPNAWVPLLTGLSISLRFALGSLPVVEYFLGWPGLGAAVLNAIRSQQSEGVAGMALALGWTFMAPNLLLDILYRRVDPRLNNSRMV